MEFPDIKALMAKRGYELLTYTPDKVYTSWYKHIDDLTIHADVQAGTPSIELSFVDLALGFHIKSGQFALDHPDYRRYERTMIAYARACQD